MFVSIFQTSRLDEAMLRRVQLAEIRALLGLPRDASHQSVVDRLAAIGETDRRVDLTAIPIRYRRLR